jgi:hypothetical protein
MSLTSTPFAGPFTTQLIAQSSANASPNNNVRGAATNLFLARVDNSANPSQVVYLHLYNNPAPTVGTTAPDVTIMVAGGAILESLWLTGISFGTALSFACTTSGGLGGSSSPTNPVAVALACS